MNCPFCGTNLAKIAAICPSCKIQLPEARLFNYYSAALDRDKSLAQPEKRSKLDSIVEKEAEARNAMLAEAKERARLEEERLNAERLKKEKEMRARQETAIEEARLKREQFFRENSKKLKVWSTVAVLAVGAAIGIANYLKPEPPKTKAAQVEVKTEPCVALGTAAKKTNTLLNSTLENYRDQGLSSAEVAKLINSAHDIQAELLGTTNGQVGGFPAIEEAIIRLSNSLGVYGESLKGLGSESEVIAKATNPIHALAVAGQKACNGIGLGNQFKKSSGWEK